MTLFEGGWSTPRGVRAEFSRGSISLVVDGMRFFCYELGMEVHMSNDVVLMTNDHAAAIRNKGAPHSSIVFFKSGLLFVGLNASKCTADSREGYFIIDSIFGGMRSHQNGMAYHVTPTGRSRVVTVVAEEAELPTDLTIPHKVDQFVMKPEVVSTGAGMDVASSLQCMEKLPKLPNEVLEMWHQPLRVVETPMTTLRRAQANDTVGVLRSIARRTDTPNWPPVVVEWTQRGDGIRLMQSSDLSVYANWMLTGDLCWSFADMDSKSVSMLFVPKQAMPSPYSSLPVTIDEWRAVTARTPQSLERLSTVARYAVLRQGSDQITDISYEALEPFIVAKAEAHIPAVIKAQCVPSPPESAVPPPAFKGRSAAVRPPDRKSVV